MPANSKRCGLGCMLLCGSPHTAGEVQNRLNNWMNTIEEEEEEEEEEEMMQCSMFNFFFFFLVLLFFCSKKNGMRDLKATQLAHIRPQALLLLFIFRHSEIHSLLLLCEKFSNYSCPFILQPHKSTTARSI